jgi:hypothetical protein
MRVASKDAPVPFSRILEAAVLVIPCRAAAARPVAQ